MDPVDNLLSSPAFGRLKNAINQTTIDLAKDLLRLIPLKVGKLGILGKQDSIVARAGIALVIVSGGGLKEAEVAKACLSKAKDFADMCRAVRGQVDSRAFGGSGNGNSNPTRDGSSDNAMGLNGIKHKNGPDVGDDKRFFSMMAIRIGLEGDAARIVSRSREILKIYKRCAFNGSQHAVKIQDRKNDFRQHTAAYFSACFFIAARGDSRGAEGERGIREQIIEAARVEGNDFNSVLLEVEERLREGEHSAGGGENSIPISSFKTSKIKQVATNRKSIIPGTMSSAMDKEQGKGNTKRTHSLITESRERNAFSAKQRRKSNEASVRSAAAAREETDFDVEGAKAKLGEKDRAKLKREFAKLESNPILPAKELSAEYIEWKKKILSSSVEED